MKITAREKRRHAERREIFTRARVSLALLSFRKNGGLLVVYPGDVIDLQEKWCEGQNGSISSVNEIKVFSLVPCLLLVGRMFFYK